MPFRSHHLPEDNLRSAEDTLQSTRCALLRTRDVMRSAGCAIHLTEDVKLALGSNFRFQYNPSSPSPRVLGKGRIV